MYVIVCRAQNVQVTLHLLTASLHLFVDSPKEKFAIAVTRLSGRLQYYDIIKCLLVMCLLITLFNFYCWFFTFT